MTLSRLCLTSLVLALAFVLAGSAQARVYSLSTGSAAQTHIGNGLALPIQPAATAGVVGTVFPPLLIPKAPGNITVMGTTAVSVQQKITVPTNALSKAASQKTVGVFFSNPTLYAVATNLGFKWPTAAAVFSTGARTGASTTTFLSPFGSITYSVPVLASKFGGPARFALSHTPGAGVNAAAPVTVYAIAVRPAGNPPCTHTALTPVPFPGPGNPACVAAIIHAVPTGGTGHGLAAAGASTMAPIVTTAGGVGGAPPMSPGVMIGKFGPIGTVSFAASTGGMMSGALNAATSTGFPWTAGRIVETATMTAAGGTEMFVLEGKDLRTSSGKGTIQMVAGALSTRSLSGTNANRAWVRLIVGPSLESVPALSPSMRVVAVGLMMLTAIGFTLRMRRQGQAI